MVQYTWPGYMFVRGGFLTTFAPVAKTGDYYFNGLSAAVGALLENGIVAFNIEDKSATFRKTDSLTTVDGSTKYWVDTEMFLKNVPAALGGADGLPGDAAQLYHGDGDDHSRPLRFSWAEGCPGTSAPAPWCFCRASPRSSTRAGTKPR